METDKNYILQSCQVKFIHTMSIFIAELPAFQELRNKSITIINDLQQTLKQQVIKHTKLKTQARGEKLKQRFLKAFQVIIEAMLAKSNTTTGIDIKIHLVIDHLKQDLLKYSDLTHTEYLEQYMQLNNTKTMPNYPFHQGQDGNGNNTLMATIETHDQKIYNNLQHIYVGSWKIC
eukprot:1554770-Ditylum_brightwellii.AAC.1